MFDLTHILTLCFFAIVTLLVFLFKDKIKNKKFEKVFRISLGIFLLALESSFHIWILSRGSYSLSMIPLTGFCALTNLLTILTLLFNKPKYFNYLIYYALTGTLFSLVFVDITYGFGHFRYFHYFFVHYGFLLGSLYYFFTGKLDITFKNFTRALLALTIYTIIVFIFDLILDQNWFYMLENPVKEISDALGYPVYPILWSLTIILLTYLWYLLLNLFSKKLLKKKRKLT